jgi:serine phosphatase RsbU (regulator of sigma subunit)
MQDGDLILLHTDGVTETPVGGRRLGTDGLAAVFARLARGSTAPAILVTGVMNELRGSVCTDDVTVLVARYSPRTGAASLASTDG